MAHFATPPRAVLSAVRADATDGKNIEKLLTDVSAQVTRIESDVKRTAEEALAQAAKTGQVSAETAAKADELIVAQKAIAEAQTKLTGRLEALETRNSDLEQRLAAQRNGGKSAGRSVGELVAQDEAIKAFGANGANGSVRVKLDVKAAITSGNTSAGDLIWSDRDREIVGIPQRQMTIRALLSAARTTSNLVEYAKQITRTNNARFVTEGTAKPESVYVWDRADAPVRTLAHIVHVTRQAFEDADQLASEVNSELSYGLALTEESALLLGDGVGQNLHGLIPQSQYLNSPVSVTGQTGIDDLRLAILQVALNDYAADGIVLHPSDWARIELTKDSQLRYIFANVVQMAGPTLWGLPVVVTNNMLADAFLVGAFRMAATIYDRMDPEIMISSEHGDNFIKNMLTVRAEERLALAVKRPASLVSGDFGNATGGLTSG